MFSADFNNLKIKAKFNNSDSIRTFSLLPVGPRGSVGRPGGPAHRDVTERRGQIVYAAGRRQAGRRGRGRDDHAPGGAGAHHAGAHLADGQRRVGFYVLQ